MKRSKTAPKPQQLQHGSVDTPQRTRPINLARENVAELWRLRWGARAIWRRLRYVHFIPTSVGEGVLLLPCLQGFSDPPKLKCRVDQPCEYFDGLNIAKW